MDHCKTRNIGFAGQQREKWSLTATLTFFKGLGMLLEILQFSVIQELWLQWIVIQLKIDHCKTKNVELTRHYWENGIHINFKVDFCNKPWGVDRIFSLKLGAIWEIWLLNVDIYNPVHNILRLSDVLTKFYCYHKWKESWLSLINMVYTSCLNSSKTI